MQGQEDGRGHAPRRAPSLVDLRPEATRGRPTVGERQGVAARAASQERRALLVSAVVAALVGTSAFSLAVGQPGLAVVLVVTAFASLHLQRRP